MLAGTGWFDRIQQAARIHQASMLACHAFYCKIPFQMPMQNINVLLINRALLKEGKAKLQTTYPYAFLQQHNIPPFEASKNT